MQHGDLALTILNFLLGQAHADIKTANLVWDTERLERRPYALREWAEATGEEGDILVLGVMVHGFEGDTGASAVGILASIL